MADYIETKEQRLFGLVPIWKTTKSKTTIHVDSEQKATNENESELNIITGTKGDRYTKTIVQRILDEGCLDQWPSSKYGDGVPAHTYSINHVMTTYDLTKGEIPLITLRPIAVKFAIGELLWIYQDQSNNLDLLKEK